MQWQTQLSEKKKRIQTMFSRYSVYAVIPDAEQKQIVLVQKHPMALDSYQVAEVKLVRTIRKP